MLDFPHKTPSTFYSTDEGFGLVETKNEGDLWLQQLPYSSILVGTEFYFSALKAGYAVYNSGLKDGEFYYVMIPKKEVQQ